MNKRVNWLHCFFSLSRSFLYLPYVTLFHHGSIHFSEYPLESIEDKRSRCDPFFSKYIYIEKREQNGITSLSVVHLRASSVYGWKHASRRLASKQKSKDKERGKEREREREKERRERSRARARVYPCFLFQDEQTRMQKKSLNERCLRTVWSFSSY